MLHNFYQWFGVRFGGIEPEFNSSFSWEDSYAYQYGNYILPPGELSNRYDKDLVFVHPGGMYHALDDSFNAEYPVVSKNHMVWSRTSRYYESGYEALMLYKTIAKGLEPSTFGSTVRCTKMITLVITKGYR